MGCQQMVRDCTQNPRKANNYGNHFVPRQETPFFWIDSKNQHGFENYKCKLRVSVPEMKMVSHFRKPIVRKLAQQSKISMCYFIFLNAIKWFFFIISAFAPKHYVINQFENNESVKNIPHISHNKRNNYKDGKMIFIAPNNPMKPIRMRQKADYQNTTTRQNKPESLIKIFPKFNEKVFHNMKLIDSLQNYLRRNQKYAICN